MSGLSIDLIEDRAGFVALEESWSALFERAGRADQIFQRHEWLRLWLDHFQDDSARLAIVAARRGGQLIMAWPLVLAKSFGVTRLAFMGEPAGQYGDALIEEGLDSALLEAVWTRLLAVKADMIHLRRVRETSPLFRFLKGRCLSVAPGQAPYVDFKGAATYDAFDKRYPGKARSTRRRLKRRLDELGPIVFTKAATCEEALPLVAKAFALKRAQLAEDGRISPTMRDRRLEHLFLAAARAPKVGALVSSIAYKSEPIAVSVSFAAKDQVFGHILAHAPGFEKQGLGVLLAEHAFRTALEAGFKRFDMAPPADAYKMDWADGAIEVDDFAKPLTRRGALYTELWLKGGRAMAKAIAGRLPVWAGRAANRGW